MCLLPSWLGPLPSDPLGDHSIRKIAKPVTAPSGGGIPHRLVVAELGGERLDLATGFLERAGTIDFLGGQAKFFLNRKLRGDAAAGFDFAETAHEETLELLLGSAPGDYQAIKIFVNAGFDQQGGFDEDRVANPSPLPRLELAEDDFRNARMDDGVEAIQLDAVGKDDGAEFCAVNAAPGGDHGLAKFLKDFAVSRLAWLDEFVGEGVGVEDGETHFAKHGGDGAFAAGDSTGKAESEHDRELSRRSCRLRGGKFWRGPPQAGGFHRVAHEHGDGHGTDAAGHGRERTRSVDRVRMDVADKGAAFGAEFGEAVRKILEEALSFVGIGDAVGADIDDGGARLDPVCFDETGFAYGGDDDIGAAKNVGEAARLGMADGDGGVGVHEKKGHGFSDDVAPAEDDGVGAFDLDIVAAQNFHAAGGSAGDQAGASA